MIRKRVWPAQQKAEMDYFSNNGKGTEPLLVLCLMPMTSAWFLFRFHIAKEIFADKAILSQ